MISAFWTWRSPPGPSVTGPRRASLSTPDEPQSKLRRRPSNARVAPFTVLRHTVPSGRVSAVISAAGGHAGGGGSGPVRGGDGGGRRERRRRGLRGRRHGYPRYRAAAEPHFAVGERHARGVVGGPAALGGVRHRVEALLSRVTHRHQVGRPGRPRAPRYTRKGGRAHPDLQQPPQRSPSARGPAPPRVASVAAEPSIRRLHSGSWPRQTSAVAGLGPPVARRPRGAGAAGVDARWLRCMSRSLARAGRRRATRRGSGRLGLQDAATRTNAGTNSRSSSGDSSGGISLGGASVGEGERARCPAGGRHEGRPGASRVVGSWRDLPVPDDARLWRSRAVRATNPTTGAALGAAACGAIRAETLTRRSHGRHLVVTTPP